MKTELTYNELELLLTPKDHLQIKNMTAPSIEQGKLVIKKWTLNYGERICSKNRFNTAMGLLQLKIFIKVRETLPELFI
jgi:hypothetical protein